ncbi:MAG: c-type cytochrome [Gemmatimonadaceae bacterium]|nr:c-type cytochrome [Gemmatimonadaceae bacterium]
MRSARRAWMMVRSGCRATALLVVATTFFTASCRQFPDVKPSTDVERQGREIFRYDTFGDEQFWTDTAHLQDVVLQKIQPLEALGLGVKVDMDKLNLAKFLLHNPFGTSGTKELLHQDAVVGLKATFDKDGHLSRLGITCALCHSTVDNALLPGIGHRLDGWPNRDLQVGKILAMLPLYTPEQKAVLRSWPKGSYDPRFNFDGKSTPLTLPPAHGLAEVKNETYTAEGPISYWNAYVAVTQMHGHGNFSDPRLGVAIVQEPDMVTPKLAALRAYQHAIGRPPTPGASYDRFAARRGKAVFDGNCASCHVGGTLTDNNDGTLHAPSETGMDSTYAARTTQKRYRTTPLRALWQHAPYFHDGSAATLDDVVNHYVRARNLQLTGGQRHDLVEYLKSL